MTQPRAAVLYRKLLSGVLLKKSSAFVQLLSRLSPALLKWVVCIALLINIRSWPGVWHLNVVVRPIAEIRLQFYALRLRNFMQPKSVRIAAKQEFFARLCPVGEDPFRYTAVVQNWASPDDCDFNWHLSNSSYPKQLDEARFRAGIKMCPTLYRAGGWTPLAATHFRFIREIPMFAKYEMRVGVAAWDDKWVYLVIRYVTPKKAGSKSKKPLANGSAKVDAAPIPSGDTAAFPAMHTPADPSGITTPALMNLSGTSTPALGSNPAERIAQLLPTEEPDGATVHCVSVNEFCFKLGRITVPPKIVLALEGFSLPPPDGSAPRYTFEHPPPSFVAAQALQTPDAPYGHLKTLQKFLRGGWKDVPEGARWWEDALGGDIEERRRRNLEAVKGVRLGMEGATTSHL